MTNQQPTTVPGSTPADSEPTPIYDQLMDETYGQVVRNMEYKGRPVRIKFLTTGHQGAVDETA